MIFVIAIVIGYFLFSTSYCYFLIIKKCFLTLKKSFYVRNIFISAVFLIFVFTFFFCTHFL